MRLDECGNCGSYVPTNETGEVEILGIWMDYCQECYEEYQNRGLRAITLEAAHMLLIMLLLAAAGLVVLGILGAIVGGVA